MDKDPLATIGTVTVFQKRGKKPDKIHGEAILVERLNGSYDFIKEKGNFGPAIAQMILDQLEGRKVMHSREGEIQPWRWRLRVGKHPREEEERY